MADTTLTYVADTTDLWLAQVRNAATEVRKAAQEAARAERAEERAKVETDRDHTQRTPTHRAPSRSFQIGLLLIYC